MKKIFYTIMKSAALAIAGCFVLACADFMEYNSPSTYDDNYVYATEFDINMAVSGIYTSLLSDNLYGYSSWALFYNSDIEYTPARGTSQNMRTDMTQLNITPYNRFITIIWDSYWAAVGLANNVIKGIGNSELYKTEKPSAKLKHHYGEAVTLRALLYYDLVRAWGDVPYITSPMTADEELKLSVTDRDEILASVIKDLIAVEPNMMYGKDSGSGIERVNREYCQALIARIALLRAGYSLRPDTANPSAKGIMQRNEEDYMTYYEIARKYSLMVIESGAHDLISDFSTVFDNEMNYMAPLNDDIIFELPFKNGLGGRSTVGYRNGIRIAAATDNGHPWGPSSGEVFIPHIHMYSFDPEDTRRFVTGCMYQVMSNGTVQILSGDNIYLGKWDKTHMTTPLGYSTPTGINFPMMRFTDVLLMFAEAENEINGPTEDAKEALARVRRRAFPSSQWAIKVDAYVSSLSSKEDLFNAIVDERSWEFAGECIRQTDLARWNLLGSKVRKMLLDWVQLSKEANSQRGTYTMPDGEELVFNKPYILYWYTSADGKFDLKGFDEQLPVAPVAPGNTAYKAYTGWCSRQFSKSATGVWGPLNEVILSYSGWSKDGLLLPEDSTEPVVYLKPIPQTTIDAAGGKITNYYGY